MLREAAVAGKVCTDLVSRLVVVIGMVSWVVFTMLFNLKGKL